MVGSPEMPMMCTVLGSPSVTAMTLRAAPLSAETSAQSKSPLSGSCREVVRQQDGPWGAQAFPKKLHVKVESQGDCSFFSLQTAAP